MKLNESLKQIRFWASLLNEGEGCAAGGDAGGACCDAGGAIDTGDVLGPCDHSNGGYFGCGPDCFHTPMHVVNSPYSRFNMCYGEGSRRKKGKKKRKENYGKVKIIKSYNDLVSESEQAGMILVHDIPHDEIEDIISSSDIRNTRFNINLIKKYLRNENIEFVGLNENGEFKALAAVEFGNICDECCYIALLDSFQKGYGKILLQKIIDDQDAVALMANPDDGEKLCLYYRSSDFNFKEYVIDNSVFGNPLHFFYTEDVDEQKIRQYANIYDKDNNLINESDGFRNSVIDNIRQYVQEVAISNNIRLRIVGTSMKSTKVFFNSHYNKEIEIVIEYVGEVDSTTLFELYDKNPFIIDGIPVIVNFKKV